MPSSTSLLALGVFPRGVATGFWASGSSYWTILLISWDSLEEEFLSYWVISFPNKGFKTNTDPSKIT